MVSYDPLAPPQRWSNFRRSRPVVETRFAANGEEAEVLLDS